MAEFSIIDSTHHDIYPFISPTAGLKDAASGRTVIVTGAGSGIGKGCAELFAQAGAKTLILVGRTLEKVEKVKASLEKSYGKTTILVQSVDVSKVTDVEQLFARLKNEDVHADVLINNAGVSNRGTIADGDPKMWWQSFEIMLNGPYLMTHHFIRQLPTGGRPASVVMVSSLASYVHIENGSSYAASKAALNRLTEWIASENKGRVQAVAFHPGGVPDTGMTSKSPEFMLKYYTETVELAAGTALYLSSPRAAWLSGRYVDATWDMEKLEGMKEKIEREDLLKMSLLGDVRPTIS